MENKDIINDKINHIKDYELDFFGFKTLEKSYLKIDEEIVEDHYLFMRVALCIAECLEKHLKLMIIFRIKSLLLSQIFLMQGKENN